MQKLHLLGNVGQDAIVNDLPSGHQVVNFSLAVTEKYKEETKTTWYRCSYFKNDAKVAQYIKKGTKLLIVGKPDVETYQSNTGETKVNLKCIVQELHFAGSQNQTDNTQSAPVQQRQQHAGDDFLKGNTDKPQEDDHLDLPF